VGDRREVTTRVVAQSDAEALLRIDAFESTRRSVIAFDRVRFVDQFEVAACGLDEPERIVGVGLEVRHVFAPEAERTAVVPMGPDDARVDDLQATSVRVCPP
jgi:hypothetical protein